MIVSRLISQRRMAMDIYIIALLAVMVVGMIAQAKVSSTFSQYSGMDSGCGKAASQVARELLSSSESPV